MGPPRTDPDDPDDPARKHFETEMRRELETSKYWVFYAEDFIQDRLKRFLDRYKSQKASPYVRPNLTYTDFWSEQKQWFKKLIRDHVPGVEVTGAGLYYDPNVREYYDPNGWYNLMDR